MERMPVEFAIMNPRNMKPGKIYKISNGAIRGSNKNNERQYIYMETLERAKQLYNTKF